MQYSLNKHPQKQGENVTFPEQNLQKMRENSIFFE